MKNILLPTDFSENAWNAILYATNLYKNEACKFTFLHAYAVNDYHDSSKLTPIPSEENLKKAEDLTNHDLKKLIEILKRTYPNALHIFEKISANKSLIQAISLEISSNNYSCIIIGTQGVTSSYNTIFGSNTIAMMEQIKDCPILAIPSHVNFTGLKEIVLVNGYKISQLKKDLGYVIELAKDTNAAIRVLHIDEGDGMSKVQKDNKRLLDTHLKEVSHSFHSLAHVSIPIGIYCFTESRGSDMIAFINKKHSFFEKLLFHQLYRDVGKYSLVPVLVLQKNLRNNKNETT